MKWSLYALLAGFLIDLIIGDPHGLIHPVILIGKQISFFEKLFRRIFPKTDRGERAAGAFLWFAIAVPAFACLPHFLSSAT